MTGFHLLDPTETWVSHIVPPTNLTLSNLQRGHFELLEIGRTNSSIYVAPPLALYTKFSLQSHFMAFWAILFLQIITIFITDKIWTRNIPESATLWERLMHANLKSHFPLPFTNWHEDDGDCNDHVKRHRAENHEVLVTTAVNLFFNLIMLTPLVILCKSRDHASVSDEIKMKIVIKIHVNLHIFFISISSLIRNRFALYLK